MAKFTEMGPKLLDEVKMTKATKISRAKSVKPGEKVPSPQKFGDSTREQIIAKLAFAPPFSNAYTAHTYLKEGVGELDLPTLLNMMIEKVTAVRKGDLSGVEATLTAQAVALDSIFNTLARRAAANFAEHFGAGETFLRLALKAQSQCRATLETLAEIKNPRPLAFVKQANIAQGPQQVNNGVEGELPRARKIENAQSKLLDTKQGERLDAQTATAGSTCHPPLEAVAFVNRPENA